MVKIRLARHGAKKRPYYHVVVADADSPRDGRFLEQLGTYDPSRPDDEIRLDLERVDYWLGVGAQLTVRARKVLNTVRRRPADPAGLIESVLIESAPVESAPVESAPVESAPVESAPVESAPVENGA